MTNPNHTSASEDIYTLGPSRIGNQFQGIRLSNSILLSIFQPQSLVIVIQAMVIQMYSITLLYINISIRPHSL